MVAQVNLAVINTLDRKQCIELLEERGCAYIHDIESWGIQREEVLPPMKIRC